MRLMENYDSHSQALHYKGAQFLGQIFQPNVGGACYVSNNLANNSYLPKSVAPKQIIQFSASPACPQVNHCVQRPPIQITNIPGFAATDQRNLVGFGFTARPTVSKEYGGVPVVSWNPRVPVVFESLQSSKFPQFQSRPEVSELIAHLPPVQGLKVADGIVTAKALKRSSKKILPSVSSSDYSKAVAGALAYRAKRKKRQFSDMQTVTKQELKKKELNTEFKKRRRTSVYRGVFWSTSAKAWVARMMFESKSKHLGYFDKESEAARAYDREQLACRADKVPFLNFENSPEYVISGKSENLVTRHVKPQAEKTSEFRGVCWHKSNSAWKASILVNGRNTHIGYFADERKAAKAYDVKAILVRKQNAKLNFPGKLADYLQTIAQKEDCTETFKFAAEAKDS